MTDLLFNTLLAVMAVCSNHAHTFTIDNQGNYHVMNPPGYEKGYERCEEISKAVDAEVVRRSDVAKQEQQDKDAADIANALDGLHGKPYKEQPKPAPPKSFMSCWNIDTEIGAEHTLITR